MSEISLSTLTDDRNGFSRLYVGLYPIGHCFRDLRETQGREGMRTSQVSLGGLRPVGPVASFPLALLVGDL